MEKVLTKDELMILVRKRKEKAKLRARNQADCYIWDKARMCGALDAKHKSRQPFYKSK